MPHKRFFFVGHVFDQASIDDLRTAISNACITYGWSPLYADERVIDGHILTDKIIPDIQLSEFCLFDISNIAKPNVFIELGIAKGMGKQCILLLRQGNPPPSDLEGYDRINYSSYRRLEIELQSLFLKPPIVKSAINLELDKKSKEKGFFARVYASATEFGTISETIIPARYSVQILGLCGNPIETATNLLSIIKDKANSGCNFKFLQMDPKSDILRMRSIEEDSSAKSNRLSLQSEAAIYSLTKLRESVNDQSTIQIGLYNHLPSLAYIQADECAYIGPYLFGKRGIDSCWFSITRDTNPIAFQQYLDMYERLWTDKDTKII